MPLIRYTLTIEGEDLVETDYFEHCKEPEQIVTQLVVEPLQKRRKELNEPPLSLTRVEVVNPHVHEHTWVKTHVSKFTLRAGYKCDYCEVTGHKPFNFVLNKETSDRVTRDEQFKKDKFALCRDYLKPLPKLMTFR